MKSETKYILLLALCRFILFWIYCILGALVFMAIEGNKVDGNDLTLYKEIRRNLTKKYNINETMYDKLTKELEEATQHLFVDQSDWSFGNSLLFVQSIVTTIGYGHITPATTFGRLFCIVYAIFGIPICLAMLAVVGNVLRIMHMSWITRLEKHYPLPLSCDAKCAIVCGFQMILVILIGAAVHTEVDNWSFDEGVYAWFITFATIGFGDFIPGYSFVEGKFGFYHGILIYRIFFDIFGLCVVAALLVALSNILQRCKFCLVCCCKDKLLDYEKNIPNNNDTGSTVQLETK